MGKIIHEELSRKIIGAAMEVLNELKPGLDEKLYERAMIIELKRGGHIVSVQSSFPVFYRTELIGNLIPDLIVDGAVIRRSKSGHAFYRNAHRSNDWLFEHYRPRFGDAAEFQKLTLGMETRLAFA